MTGFTFWYELTHFVLEKRLLNGCSVVVVIVVVVVVVVVILYCVENYFSGTALLLDTRSSVIRPLLFF